MFRLDRRPEILQHHPPEGVQVVMAVALPHRQSRCPDAVLEPAQLPGVLVVLGTEVGLPLRRQGGDERRVPEVEVGVRPHLGIVQHALVDLHRCDRVSRLDVPQRVEPLLVGDVVGRRNPPVPLSQKPDEERTAVLDLPEADLQSLTPLGILLGHAPAEVHVHEVEVPLGALFPQFREDYAHEVIPFRMHIAESRGNEHADRFPGSRHGLLPLVRQLLYRIGIVAVHPHRQSRRHVELTPHSPPTNAPNTHSSGIS